MEVSALLASHGPMSLFPWVAFVPFFLLIRSELYQIGAIQPPDLA